MINASHLHLYIMAKIDFKQLTSELRLAGLKITPARLAILGILKTQPQPLSINDIKKRLGVAQIDLVTVYRTAEHLEKLGIIRKVLINDEEAFYEYTQTHHHHLVCKNCGKTEDFEICNTKNLIQQVLSASRLFGQVSDHSFELFGFCNNCLN